jgi:chromosome segregation ATPase
MTRAGMPWRTAAVVVAALAVSGCRSVYYSTMEKFGVHKRDLLVRDVGAARDSQEEAKEQFVSALERFSTVLELDGGDLQDKYETLDRELQRSEAKAATVRNRIDDVEAVSKALFREWRKELEQYNDADLRRSSAAKLDAAEEKYDRLLAAMRRAESRMDPVIAAFRDQVLYLKHNLNARAIASLQGELAGVEADVEALIRDMEASIAEADSFIRSLGA